MKFRRTTVLLLLGLVFCAASLAWGQGTTSKVVGIVQDPTGAVIPGAAVTLTNQSTSVSFSTQTTAAGTYVFESVQIGVYTLEVQAAGFKKFISTGNALTIGQPLTINVSLEIGAVAEVVEVTETYERVQTSTSGNFGNLVDTRALTSLPIVGVRGRNPIDFTLFQPGVVSGANTGGGVHVHGARDRAWNFTLDGIDINETSAGGSNFAPLRTNPDSLAEFRVLTGSFTAEYGRNSGGQVALVTRSGGNDFHGTAFWFYRTPSLNANTFANNLLGITKPQFVQHIGGFSVGGPVWKNKTFFFTNLQILRTSEKRTVTSTVYTADARRGIIRYITSTSALCPGQTVRRNASSCVDASGNPLPGLTIGTYDIGARDPAARGLEAAVKAIIDLTPLPNNFNTGDGLNTAGFSFVAPQKEEQEDFVVKVDHIFTPRNTVYVRYARGRQDTVGDFVNDGWSRFPNTPRVVDTNRSPGNLAINWRWNPTSRLTNELVVGGNHFTFNFANPDPDYTKNPPFVLNTVTDPIFNYLGNRRTINTYQIVDNVTFISGAHTFKGGLNFRYQQHIDNRGSVAGLNVQPEVSFSTGINTVDPAVFNLPTNINTSFDRPTLQAAINNLLGRVGRVAQAFVAVGNTYGPPGTAFDYDARYGEYDFYIQDTWKARPNLTFDFGLRWEVKLSPRDPRDRILVPDQPFVLGAPGSNTLRWVPGKLWADDWNNFGPIIGLAWDPFKTGKTSLRANYRLAYDRLNTFVISSTIFQSMPGHTLAVINESFGRAGGRIRDGIPVLASPAGVTPETLRQPAAFSTAGIHVMDPDLKTPQTHMWGLSIQRELWKEMVVEVTYLGRHGVNLFGGYDVNQVNIFAASGAETFLQAFSTVRAGGDSALMNRLLGPHPSRRTTETGSQLARRIFASTLNLGSVAGLAASINTTINPAQGNRTLLDLAGLSPFFFMPFPQLAGSLNVLDSNDISTYHAMEVQLSRRFARGLGFQVSYTWAKSLDTRSFDPAFSRVSRGAVQSASSTPFDLRNRRLNKARSDFDRRHALQGYWVYELPFGRGRRWGSELGGVLERIVGGWEVSGVLVWYSGRPFTVYSGSSTLSNVVNSPADCTGCPRSLGQVHLDPVSGRTFYLSADERTKFSIPAPGTLGNTGRNYFQVDESFSMDGGITKRTRITETHSLEFRLEMQNLTNRPLWDVPTATVTSSVFGRLFSTASGARRMQLVLKYHF